MKSDMQKYMEMTGQDFQEVMGGSTFVGPAYVEKLVSQALEQKKKIVWVMEDSETDRGHYEFVELS